MQLRILVVEDDPTTADLVAVSLRRAGHHVTVELDGGNARDRLDRESFDLCVLDVMLPGCDGHELCHRIRENSEAGIVFLTARTLEKHRIEGLHMGADDYVTKPFSLAELVARVDAVLRRVPLANPPMLACGPVRLDVRAHRAFCGDLDLHLTPSEFAVVRTLLEHSGQALTRGQLLDRLPGENRHPLDRVIDVHVRNVRRKVAAAGWSGVLIETVHGVGYRGST